MARELRRITSKISAGRRNSKPMLVLKRARLRAAQGRPTSCGPVNRLGALLAPARLLFRECESHRQTGRCDIRESEGCAHGRSATGRTPDSSPFLHDTGTASPGLGAHPQTRAFVSRVGGTIGLWTLASIIGVTATVCMSATTTGNKYNAKPKGEDGP